MQKIVIEEIAGSIDIPESAYEKAERRYKDLGDWFDRKEGKCSACSPYIYSQGSFRLGTVIRPLDDKDEYDLDVGCRLNQGISKTTHTQKYLKELVGADLEEYRKVSRIQNHLDEKHRCWRLQYADEMSFHMDVVPSIPEEARRIQSLQEAMVKNGRDKFLAEEVARFAGAITDNQDRNYELINGEWRISNSEGYAKWFEYRMKLGRTFLERRVVNAKVAKIDDLPARKWKSPLQRCVQILKRHRDIMFKDDLDERPISIIITTLAAEAYQGEDNIESAMQNILSRMGDFVRKQDPRVPNPVNPAEDFADKWAKNRQLEQNFWNWLQQAQTDFQQIGDTVDAKNVADRVQRNFSVRLNESDLQKRLGLKEASSDHELKYSGPIIIDSKPSGRHFAC
jgi:flagellar biosynthesis chaperone FliJ